MKNIFCINTEGGSVSVIVGIGLVALMGFGALAVDLGYMKLKRGQLQAAADAAALAGAAAVVSYGLDTSKIVEVAVAYGRANISASDKPEYAVTSSDVTINRASNYVEVGVGMTEARGNPVNLFLGPVLSVNKADISATARAAIYCSNGSKCLKPWAIPTKFTWNDSADSHHSYKNNGALDLKSSEEMASVQVVGYSSSDVGTQVTLKYGSSGSSMAPSSYNAINFPPNQNTSNSASDYRQNISGCEGTNQAYVELTDSLSINPGNMQGPTRQGVDDIIAQDPGAYWDSATKSIKGSSQVDPLNSPRVAIVAFYSPADIVTNGGGSQLTAVKVYQMGAVFVEGIDSNGNVLGRFINSLASSSSGEPAEKCGMLYAVKLVRDSSR